ncbi:MAG: hypothetical protein ABII19_01860 [Patescibacteria group bacterium]
MAECITREEAQRRLGGASIYLEPEAIVKKKLTEGKGTELWIYFPDLGRIARGDGKFFDILTVDRGGWFQPVIHEERHVPTPEDGSPRVVGHVIVETNGRGFVRVRRAKGLNGEILELKPSSLSKGELAEKGLLPHGYFESNPQRIEGMIAAYLALVDFPDEEGMTPSEFRRQSTDGRSLAALAKVGL